jgi:hypothetical protein
MMVSTEANYHGHLATSLVDDVALEEECQGIVIVRFFVYLCSNLFCSLK